jgi:hypothetical protein
VRFEANTLYDPQSGLELGTHYLKQMINAFGGRVERALAAYNAGPSRVARWTAGRRNMTAEEFVDYIPYPETRQYVMTILAAQEQYRRIYSLPHAGALALVAEQGVPVELEGADAPAPAFRPPPPPLKSVAAKAGKKVSRKAGTRTASSRKVASRARASKRPAAPRPRRAPRRSGRG